jgi:hypothetical protein
MSSGEPYPLHTGDKVGSDDPGVSRFARHIDSGPNRPVRIRRAAKNHPAERMTDQLVSRGWGPPVRPGAPAWIRTRHKPMRPAGIAGYCRKHGRPGRLSAVIGFACVNGLSHRRRALCREGGQAPLTRSLVAPAVYAPGWIPCHVTVRRSLPGVR